MKITMSEHPKNFPFRGIKGCFKFSLLALGLLIANPKAIGQSDGLPRGCYQMPYTRYESENATRGGGAVYYAALDFDQTKTASEASNQQYVGLPSNGSYVQWTATQAGRGVTMRFTMPDNESTGLGRDGALDVYVNNVKVKTVNLTSYYAYQYFYTGVDKCEQIKGGTNKTLMRFDETHFLLDNALNAGDVIKIQKGNGDALEYGVDFIEIEPVPAVKAAPANSLSVVDYGANGNDQVDDLAAFHSCIAAASAAGKNVYIPAGKFYLSAKLNFNVQNMIFQGAGIWYTELYFSTDLQFSGGIYARCSGVTISDFYLHTRNNDRWNYNEPFPGGSIGEYKTYKGFMGTYGSNSTISNVWVEHFECGAWIAGYDAPLPVDITSNLKMTNMRIRNNYADGVNFCQGTNNSIVEHSNVRNSGDDGLAVWPNNAVGVTTPGSNNTFRYNTIENQWRAGGTALFGASGHQIHHSIYKDFTASSAIRLTTDFSGYKFDINTGIRIYENTLIRCGTSQDLWNGERGALELNATGGSIQNITYENINILESQRHAVQVGSGGGYTNVVFNNITVDKTGLDNFTSSMFTIPISGCAVLAYASSGKVTFNNLAYSNVENNPPVYNANQGFTLEVLTTGPIAVTGVDLPAGPINLVVGQSVDLIPVISPSNATNKAVTWTSSNSAVATVDANTQKLTALSTGTTTITVRTTDGGKTDVVTVNVTAAVNIVATDGTADENGGTGIFTIAITNTSSTINVGYTISGSATAGDYTANPTLTGTISLSAATPSRTITITPLNDSEFEGSENLTLTLQAGTGYQLGGNTTASVSIADNDNPPCTGSNITMPVSAITVDGTLDAAWSSAPEVSISRATLGSVPADYSGKYRALWNNTYLYFYVTVNDATKYNDSGTSWWEDDVIEIFIDGDNSKGTSYDGLNDYQLGFRYNDANINIGGNSKTNITGIVKSMISTSTGHVLEVAIPWTTIGVTPVLGNRIGIEVEIDDDDNGGTRDSQISAYATTSTAWSSPSVFGTGYLTSCGDVVIANAGADKNLAKGTTSTTLTGTGSGPGTLTYAWTKVSGPTVTLTNANTVTATVSGLTNGSSYTFQLAVTSGSTTATDIVVVNVAANVAPVANAGNDQSIQLPTNSATLSGSATDADGTISSYLWTQTSGPNTATLGGTTTATLAVSNLIEGTYVFNLRATDNDGATANDQVQVTVSTQPVYPTDRGYYDAPYKRYEANDGTIGSGATVIGPFYDTKQIASEASDRKYVNLPSSGSYVQWTVTGTNQNGFDLRYTIPDNTTGTLALYVNGAKVRDISLVSKWAYQYFNISPSTDGIPQNTNPGGTYEARMRFDELHFILATAVKTGDVIKLQKDNSDGIAYGIDFIELETVPAQIAKPTGFLNIMDYGATPNDETNDQAAFRTCLDLCASNPSYLGVYIPAGRFINSQGGSTTGNLYVANSNITIQGAGMWYTEIYFGTTNTNSAGFLFNANNIDVKDFYMNAATDGRIAGNKAVNGSLGSGSTITNVWAEHFETGFWITSMTASPWNITDGLVISNCRIRNVYADGVNLAKGTRNTTVEKCNFRNCIDDAMASWSVNYLESVPPTACYGNIFRYNTAENTLRAGGLGFFGGHSHQAYNLLIKDGLGAGIRANTQFPAYPFGTSSAQAINIHDVTVIGCGTTKNLWTYRDGAIDLELPTPTQGNMYSLQYINFDKIDVLSSQHDAIFIHSYMPSENAMVLDNITFTNVTINGTGVARTENNGLQYFGTTGEKGGYGIYAANYSSANRFDGWVSFAGSFSNIAYQDTGYYKCKSSFEIRMSGTVNVTGVTVAPTSLSLNTGATSQLTATVAPANASNKSVTWTSSNSAIATVNSTGLVTAVAAGTATITVRTVQGNFAATCNVTVTTVNVPVTGVTLSPTSATLSVGGTQQLTPTVAPANATNKNVTYTSNNTAVATVNASGLVTAVAAGSATITVTTVDQAKTATCAITVTTVNVPVTSVSLSPTTATLTATGATQQLIPTVLPANATNKNVTYASNNTSVATVNSSGLVTAVANGTATITVTTVDQAKTATCVVTVSISSLTDITNLGGTVSAQYTDSPANEDITKLIDNNSNTKYLTFHASGWVQYQSPSAYVITQYTITSANDATERDPLSWTLQGSNNGSTWTNIDSRSGIDFPNRFQKLTFSFSNSTAYIYYRLTMNNNSGTILQVAELELLGVPGTVNIPVTGVTLSPTTVSLAAGGTQQLTATVAPSNATNKAVSYASSNSAIATVNATGLVTAVAAGTATITVTTQDQAKTATCAVTVTGTTYTYYQIKNRWQNTFLYDAGDRVRYSATASGDSYLWAMEDISGVKEFRNVATGEYMHIENLLGYVQATARTSGWMSSRWTVEDAGSGFVRFKNVWQPSYYIHVENLQSQAQYGTIDASWWSAMWQLIPVTVVKVAEDQLEPIAQTADVSLWPNPVSESLNIALNGNSYKTVRVYDLTGRMEYSSEITSDQTDLIIDFSTLKSGMYIVTLIGEQNTKVLRVVKN